MRKLRHECERCGLAAEFERAGRFRDADYQELWQDYMRLERLYTHLVAKYLTACQRSAELHRQIDALVLDTPPMEPIPEEPEWPLI